MSSQSRDVQNEAGEGDPQPTTNSFEPLGVAGADCGLASLEIASSECADNLFHAAVEEGDYTKVGDLLKLGANVNSVNPLSIEGFSPLHRAVKKRHYEVAKLLISAKANVNALDKMKMSPLFYSIENEDFELTQLLLNNGANVKVISTLMLSPMHIATTNKGCSVAELLIKYKADVNVFDMNGRTPLFFSVAKANHEMTQLLLRNGAKAEDLNQLLHLAASRKSIETIEVLLHHGADVNAQDESGKTLMRLAVYKNSEEIPVRIGANLWVQTYIVDCALHPSIFKEPLQLVNLLLKYNADVSLADRSGITPLHITALHGNIEISTMLVNKGANVNARSRDGNTPLQLAVKNGSGNVAKLLLESGAHVDCVDAYGETPLHLAVKESPLEIINTLLKFGACVNAETDFGESPLALTVTITGSEDVAELLLENGAKVDCTDSDGIPMLHLATKNRSSGVVDALLTYGLRVNCFYGGKTALHISSKAGDAETVSILLDHGANVKIKCNRSYTPLNYAWGIFHTTAFREEYNQNRRKARPHPHRDTIDLLYRHQVKLEAVGFRNSGCSAKIRREEGLDGFYSDCKLEITRMKSEFIGDSNVSYYDILSKDSSFVANFMKSRSVEPTSELEDSKSKFPIYEGIIRSNIRKGWVRGKLLEKACHVFNRLRGWPKDCTDQVLDFLENDDLRVLAEV